MLVSCKGVTVVLKHIGWVCSFPSENISIEKYVLSKLPELYILRNLVHTHNCCKSNCFEVDLCQLKDTVML